MISSSLAEDARAHSLLGVADHWLIVIQPLSYLPICLYALEELSIHLQIFDKLSLLLRNLKLRGGAGARGYVCAAARSLLDRAIMLHRLKRDVETSLLPKVICKLFVDMTPLQLRLYKGILQRSDALHVSSMLSMSQLLATLSQRWSASPTTHSITHSHTLLLLLRLRSQSSRVFAIRIYHLFILMMENHASCTIDIDSIISTIIIININCLSPSFIIIIITRS